MGDERFYAFFETHDFLVLTTNMGEKQPWFMSPLFKNYWSHYEICVHWLKKNNINPVGPDLTDTIYEGETFQEEGQNKRREASLLEIKYQDDREMLHLKETAHQEDDLSSTSDDEEVSLEYLNFVMVTRRHQEERAKMKLLQNKQSQNVSYRDISKIDKPTAVNASLANNAGTEQLLKRIQSSQWYGNQGEEILNLESKQQACFDSFIRKNKPSFFPACPINMNPYFNS
jgi:hypothetical protein